MRLDPDAIMEGEMRDLISMMSTTYAAQTGHIVLTTLHTNSALGIPERMITMGYECRSYLRCAITDWDDQPAPCTNSVSLLPYSMGKAST
uniref:ATP-binding protein n=1 Tax=Escherichia coli TaxID=562 RepID=A0A3G4RTK7_ECOLX|nr:ATP-binding protein [Escherichia coli]